MATKTRTKTAARRKARAMAMMMAGDGLMVPPVIIPARSKKRAASRRQ